MLAVCKVISLFKVTKGVSTDWGKKKQTKVCTLTRLILRG